jgi:hypothetical protein
MPYTKYTYNISTDTANSKVEANALKSEIGDSTIVIAASHINTSGGFVDIWMKDALSAGDQTTLTAVVSAHAGNPLPPGPQSVTVTNNNIIVTPKLTNFANRSFIFGHNFCDKTTWFGDAVRVVGESVGTGDGTTTAFNLDNTNVIDLRHGKVTDESLLAPTAAQGGSDYDVHIYLDAVEKTEDTPFGSANDYSVNYSTGAVTFAVAPSSGAAITADYFYENGSTTYIRPSSGYKTVIVKAEAQFSKNIDMQDSLVSAVYTYNPGLGAPPAKFEYPGTKITWKRFYDFINYTNGAFPIIPAMGGASRGVVNEILQLRWEYTTAIELSSSAGAELRVWLESDNPYIGEIATITFYGYDELE